MNGQVFLDDVGHHYRQYKELCERAQAQVSDNDFFALLGRYPNSIAVLMKHLGGNMRSRWLDFLTSDGEKPDRDREGEFHTDTETRESVMAVWNDGWQIALDELGRLTPVDLERTVTVRGQPQSVIVAVNRNLAHVANHTGQIILLARHFAGDAWQTLSIAPGHSDEFNAAMRARYGDWHTGSKRSTRDS